MKFIPTLLKALPLVSNVAQAHKMWSNQGAAATVILALQEALPLWEGVVPEGVFAYLAAAAGTATIALRLLDQGLAKK